MQKYIFKKPLIEAIIKSRPNRFIFYVEIDGQLVKCHCPSTGRIGNIKFKDIPCLLSESENPERKTKYTVEAISLDAKEKSGKFWMGINQTKVNAYIEFFLKNNLLKNMVSGEIKREVKLGKSRIDFRVGNSYLEIKTPLIFIDMPKEMERVKHGRHISFDRLIKHFQDLAKSLRINSRAIVALTYLFDAKPFIPPVEDDSNKKIISAAKTAFKKGIENWQVNLKIDKEGISLIDYFKLNLFS